MALAARQPSWHNMALTAHTGAGDDLNRSPAQLIPFCRLWQHSKEQGSEIQQQCLTMRFGSTAKLLAECKLKYDRISECACVCLAWSTSLFNGHRVNDQEGHHTCASLPA